MKKTKGRLLGEIGLMFVGGAISFHLAMLAWRLSPETLAAWQSEVGLVRYFAGLIAAMYCASLALSVGGRVQDLI